MFGIESGSQKILDRLKKEQTLEQIETAVHAAKKAGIEIVHGFFVVGNPDETEEDMVRHVPLRVEAAARHLRRSIASASTAARRSGRSTSSAASSSDTDDWYKYFKCSSIDPTVLPGEKIHEIRSRELKRLIVYKFLHFPLQALRLTARLVRNMPWRDVVLVFVKPFLGKKSGQTKAEVLSRAVEREAIMSAAADLTQVPDGAAHRCLAAERG